MRKMGGRFSLANSLPHPQYRPDIDGLRAIAVSAVIAFHVFPNVFRGGFVGVDIFFVISGFLISSIIFKGLEQSSFSFVEFYSRRIRRIFPALLVVLVACLAFGWIALLAGEYKQLGKHTMAGAAFFSNVIFWQESGYFDIAGELKPLLHLWSLGVEEQFYIVWPVLLFVTSRIGWHLGVTMVLVAAISFGLNISEVHLDPALTFFLPHTRFWEFLVGAALATPTSTISSRPKGILRNAILYLFPSINQQLRLHSVTINNMKAWFGLFLIMLAIFGLHKGKAFPGWWALAPTMGAALLISAGPEAWLNRKILTHRAMVFLGLISFPLYLWHWPLLSFARIVESGKPPFGIRIAAVLLSVLLAWLTYRLIERPIRFSPKLATPVVLVVVAVFVAAAGHLVDRRDGFKARTERIEQEVTEMTAGVTIATAECKKKYDFHSDHRCLIGDISRPPTILLVGDSHANPLYYPFDNRLGTKENVMLLGHGGCLPFFDVESSLAGNMHLCAKVMNEMLTFATASDSIKTVVLASRGTIYFTGVGFGDADHKTARIEYRGSPEDEDPSKTYVDAMEYTFRRFVEAGKTVYFVIDNPELGFDPKSCLDVRPFRLTNHVRVPCAISRSAFDNRNASYRKAINAVLAKFPSVRVLDIPRYLCDQDHCWAMIDGQMMYADADHLSLKGAMYLNSRWPLASGNEMCQE